MKKGIIAAIFIWMLFLLQSTVFQSLSFNGIVPNLLIVLTASYGFMSGEKWGLIVGFFCGLLCDIFFGDVIEVLEQCEVRIKKRIAREQRESDIKRVATGVHIN